MLQICERHLMFYRRDIVVVVLLGIIVALLRPIEHEGDIGITIPKTKSEASPSLFENGELGVCNDLRHNLIVSNWIASIHSWLLPTNGCVCQKHASLWSHKSHHVRSGCDG
ncbi:uncharacterized protein A4U43_C10F7060 [Asparagus officinalis]|uniref:Uncharacterized protein n=1 Tax=Asparagus officinalis TaxID=4686 RepID=A0A5P1E171_ASPOF|nr:uncharacterized protein A4U43_C10F7060 [Asparagus officinalis]